MTRKDFVLMMNRLRECFPRQLNELTYQVYWENLKENLAANQIRKAFELAEARCRKFPSPAELIELGKTIDPLGKVHLTALPPPDKGEAADPSKIRDFIKTLKAALKGNITKKELNEWAKKNLNRKY